MKLLPTLTALGKSSRTCWVMPLSSRARAARSAFRLDKDTTRSSFPFQTKDREFHQKTYPKSSIAIGRRTKHDESEPDWGYPSQKESSTLTAEKYGPKVN